MQQHLLCGMLIKSVRNDQILQPHVCRLHLLFHCQGGSKGDALPRLAMRLLSVFGVKKGDGQDEGKKVRKGHLISVFAEV